MTNTSPGRWGVDTNVLIYLFDQESPFHRSTIRVLKQAVEKRVELVITHQNIVEFVRVLNDWYHLPIREVIEHASSLVERDISTVSPLPTTLKKFLRLCQSSTNGTREIFDLYLAATLLDHGVTTLVTNDRGGFQRIHGFRIIPISS